ncbi:MAG: hypothetical protein V1835_03700 [Candidatus Micrarchaeota archaeon]
MNWGKFATPTMGKLLITIFFLLVPIPLPMQVAAVNQAKYTPLLFVPFLKTSTIYAYVVILLTIVLFYILACLISHLYHKYILRDLPTGDSFE